MAYSFPSVRRNFMLLIKYCNWEMLNDSPDALAYCFVFSARSSLPALLSNLINNGDMFFPVPWSVSSFFEPPKNKPASRANNSVFEKIFIAEISIIQARQTKFSPVEPGKQIYYIKRAGARR